MTGVDQTAFRRAAGRFASGIVVVSTSLDGVSHAMTATAFTAVSLDPLLVLVCVEKIARFHDSVLATGTWAVSVLGEESEKAAAWLATRGRPLEGQLDAFRHHAGPATGAPILDDALTAMECRTTAVHDGGDHSIVVGEVVGVSEPRPGDAVREVRGRGLWAGVEFASMPGRQASEHLAARGVLVKDTHGTTIRLAPPLTISEEDLDWALDLLEEMLRNP